MGGTVLITLGRLPVGLDLARSFHARGWRVLVADPFIRHVTGASKAVAQSFVVPAPHAGKSVYLDALAALVTTEKIDLIVPVSEETMHVAHLEGRLPNAVRLYAAPPSSLLGLHDKARFNEIARSLDLPAPETHPLGSPGAEALAASMDFIVKPVFSSSGRGVSLHRRGDALPAMRDPAIVQRRIEGEHLSTFAIAHAGDVAINVVYRGTVMSASVAVAFERVEHAPIDAWVRQFVEKTGHSGFISFDFIVEPDGIPHAIECNPRATSGLHFVETGDLAPAILWAGTAALRFRNAKKLQQFYPCLATTEGSILRPREFHGNLRHFFTSRDVSWDRTDPMPFISQPVSAFALIARAIRNRQGFAAAATEDIGWFEGERPDHFGG